ncbi:ATP-binding protein [Paenibacillus rhizolycopersici]|uniref:ATP-binding protein n=1 Tax=Paenibacillus rhizolycopersici TaxID=2780073 RepID=UPI003D2B5350
MIPFHLPILISIVFVLGYQLLLYFDSVFGRSARKPHRIVHFIVFVLVSTVYLTVDMGWGAASGVALLLIYCLADSYQVELKNKLMYTVLYAVLMSIVNSLSLFVFYTLNSDEFRNFEPSSFSASAKTLLLSCTFMFVVVQLIRLMAKRRTYPLKPSYYLLFLFVPVFSIYQVNRLAAFSEKNLHFFIWVIGLLLLNVLVIYMFDTMMEKFQFQQENFQLQRQMDYQDANYEKTVHSFKSIKRIIHDTNQQFLYVEECIKRGDPAAALEHLRVTLNKVEDAYHRVNTGHLVIDALVTNALNIGEANGIRIDTQLSLYSQDLNIDRYDLCVVLGNMLDNALEASKKVKIAEDRYILIRIRSDESALSIQIKNQTEHEVIRLQSQKPNREFHGIGLTNISRICEKYGGNMTIETGSKSFNNMVVLPFGD